MDIMTLKLFAQYNEKINIEMDKIISGLSRDQWEKEFKGFFNSVKSMCNHIYICDFNWLMRFSKLRKFEFIENKLFHESIGFDETVINYMQDYIGKRNELDIQINKFINEVKQEDLNKQLKYVDSHGKENTRNFGGAILHMFNHETHHRGMISIYLEEMGIENDYSNLIALV
jgi:uncharacterized damage-inducible protein DinB